MNVLLAVSGGIDSMFLAENARDLFPGAAFAAAHCNFGLRGEESDADEAFVRRWCSDHGMVLYVKRFDTSAFAERHGISIEMAARELRYGWFGELCREKGLDGVAVAHNSNDNAETLLLNMLRGTGSRGMRGMPSLSGNSPVIFRPMLTLSRQEIENWMRTNGKTWREDRTNAETVYKRNKIRHRVMPVLAEINPAYLRTLASDMEHIAQVDDIAEEWFLAARERITDERGISIPALRAEKHWKYLLFRTMEPLGMGHDTLARLENALESAMPASGKTFGPVITSDGHLIVLRQTGDAMPEIEILDKPDGLDPKAHTDRLMLDAAPFEGKPVPRRWQDGDWMVPLGMKGRRKLSDMFTDMKLSIQDKQEVWVLEYPGVQGRVAAFVSPKGGRIDDSLKIKLNTKKIISLSLAGYSDKQ